MPALWAWASVPACSSPSRPLRAGVAGAAARQPGLRLRAPVGERGWGCKRAARQREGADAMAFIVAELSIELAEAVEPLLARIKARDKNLEDQIRRAVESVVGIATRPPLSIRG